MATIIYKKYFKKTPSEPRPCVHQQASASGSSPETISSDEHAFEAPDANGVGKYGDKTSTLDGSQCSICREEAHRMTVYRRKLMLGLLFPFLVQSLDSTIIAGAVPFIASDFRKTSQS
jgi:hypothetical protein